MIGNDIIDLSYARQTSNWQRPRWLDKLFSSSERTLITQSPNPESMVWLLWSMKESAYKVIIQTGKTPFYAPRRLACQLSKNNSQGISGLVHYDNQVFSTQSTTNDRYIHTLAFSKRDKHQYNSSVIVFPETTSPRKCLYQNILQEYDRKPKSISASNADLDQHRDLRIIKNNSGVPFIFRGAIQQSTALSISHHGRYGAFVFTER